jgi:hypothetical protein
MFLPTGVMNCHDRNPVKEKPVNTTTESEKNASAPEIPQPKTKRAAAKKAKPAKKASRAKKPATKPKADLAHAPFGAIGLVPFGPQTGQHSSQ